MNELDENDLVLRLTVEQLRTAGEWPELRDLHDEFMKTFTSKSMSGT